jgi:hypothetical protein
MNLDTENNKISTLLNNISGLDFYKNLYNAQKAEAIFLFTYDSNISGIRPMTLQDFFIANIPETSSSSSSVSSVSSSSVSSSNSSSSSSNSSSSSSNSSSSSYNYDLINNLLKDDIVGYWKFENNLNDDSVFNSTGINVNDTVGFEGGRIGNSIYLNGTNYIDIGDKNHLNFSSTDVFSVSCFIKTNSNSFSTIISKTNELYNGYYMAINDDFYTSNSTGKLLIDFIDSNSQQITLIAGQGNYLNDNNWHHIVFSYDGTKNSSGIKIYLDNVLQQSRIILFDNTINVIENTGSFRIGDLNNESAYRYSGNIDEIVIWNKILSEEEINYLYINHNIKTSSSSSSSNSSSSSSAEYQLLFDDSFNISRGSNYTTTIDSKIGDDQRWAYRKRTDIDTDFGARIHDGVLELTNDATDSGNVNGYSFVYVNSTVHFDINLTHPLKNNNGLLEWSFNMRNIRTDPAGFGSASTYGSAFILAGSNLLARTAGSGYAVVHGQTGDQDPIRLVKYSGGLQGTAKLTNIITGNQDFGSEYLGVKVTYDPSNDEWKLYGQSGTSFQDNNLNNLNYYGNAVDSTFTLASNLIYMGAYWQASTAANQNAIFDNVSIKLR